MSAVPASTRLHHSLPGWRLREEVRLWWCRLPFTSPRGLVKHYTMIPTPRLVQLEASARRVASRGIEGEAVECGCAEGGSAALLALTLDRVGSAKKVYLYDTFEGLPEPTENDPASARRWVGKCKGSLEDVKGLFDDLGISPRAVFVKGRFESTLPQQAPDRIALLHLDGDWYESTKHCLEALWDRVSPGGIMQVDDYGDWEGCRKAVDEFFSARGITQPKHFIDNKAFWIEKV